MRPYWQRDGITIYCGDCREVLPTLTDDVDVIVTDPPYGETSLTWDVPVSGWIDACRPLLKASGSLWCFGSLRFFMTHAADFGREWQHVQEIVWEKHNGSIFHADRFRRVHELLVHFRPSTSRWADIYKSPQFTMDATAMSVRRKTRPAHSGNIGKGHYISHDGGPRLMRSVLQVRSCHGHAKHPTQKPEGIIRPVLAYSLPPGGLVLDPFMGSGSTLAVAREMGRRAIGIELEERYCEIAVTRLAQQVLPLAV